MLSNTINSGVAFLPPQRFSTPGQKQRKPLPQATLGRSETKASMTMANHIFSPLPCCIQGIKVGHQQLYWSRWRKLHQRLRPCHLRRSCVVWSGNMASIFVVARVSVSVQRIQASLVELNEIPWVGRSRHLPYRRNNASSLYIKLQKTTTKLQYVF